ncbi:phosphatidylinositol-specific phospholipase C [Usitatibacter palustris]|uniref:1-phosphatidylinositol phosphodiesterase n=1 Tax=Usitatibacter palustris TaxID=2732487 RepID=A0A6M4H576_9PROT|nr:phosphatidylinositol-specific phospholipase C [Usitatibacter palustris]QJR14630.1 hypothetical protein DSM104440_01437 [Usitatibacter palustris]
MITNVFSRTARAISLAAALATPFAALAHNNPGYSHDSGPGGNYSKPSWMGALADGRKISELSVPGSHDTMSHHGGDIAKTQSMPLATQLNSGIRALDIRCRHVKNGFPIYHGIIDQKADFRDVLNTAQAFLKANPRETILMRVKEEHTPDGNTRTFEQTFEDYVAKYPGLFWTGTGTNPTLGEVRGKIVVLQDFRPATKTWGLMWNTFDIQDDFSVKTNWDLEGKWNKVSAQVQDAFRGDANKVYVNFLSASGGSFPYFIASGHSSPGTGAPRLATGKTTPGWKNCCKMFPRVNCAIGICTIAFEGTNTLMYDTLKTLGIGRVGIIYADFPGYGLIDEIIKRN